MGQGALTPTANPNPNSKPLTGNHPFDTIRNRLYTRPDECTPHRTRTRTLNLALALALPFHERFSAATLTQTRTLAL